MSEGEIPDLSHWIGRSRQASDTITPRLVREFRATLQPHLAQVSGAPPGLHWCLAPDALPPDSLGDDGHPRRGLVLPPVPYPRRMWAGGALSIAAPLAEGDAVSRTSTVADVRFRTGRSGRLAFVTVHHRYVVAGRLAIDERQDIVYRAEERAPAAAVPAPPPVAGGEAWTVAPDPTLLFRYSALTFNGHRIHYDHPYATGVEGYRGLIVHAPLQATLLLNLLAARLGALPANFSYRALAPLACCAPFTVEAAPQGENLAGRVLSAEGVATMEATASR